MGLNGEEKREEGEVTIKITQSNTQIMDNNKGKVKQRNETVEIRQIERKIYEKDQKKK